MPTISAVAGKQLYIKCPVAGYPIEAIIWEKGKKPIRSFRFKFTEFCFKRILPVDRTLSLKGEIGDVQDKS